jgi:hypothetical protein
MTLIETKIVGAGGSTLLEFTNIPQTFTDLVMFCSMRDNFSNVSNDATLNVNGSTITFRQLYGTGQNIGANIPTQIARPIVSASASANVFGSTMIQFPNYSSTTTYKNITTDSVSEQNGTESYQVVGSGLLSSNSAITTITIDNGSSTFVQGTSVSLYGVSKTTTNGVAKATGGTITYGIGGMVYHTFTASGTFTPTTSLTADVLVVGGGGGGGNTYASTYAGGGGGAGGYRTATGLSFAASAYSVVIGAGGSGYANGNASSIASITSAGGGHGANGGGEAGVAGGSGGGSSMAGGYNGPAGAGNTPSVSPSQGNNGGTGAWNNRGGGGGGAGSAGSNGSSNSGAGGAGVAWINGSYYAGGGGGASAPNASVGAGAGGIGGGGAGDSVGSTNTGGGGGAGSGASGYSGGSGVVIVRYQG